MRSGTDETMSRTIDRSAAGKPLRDAARAARRAAVLEEACAEFRRVGVAAADLAAIARAVGVSRAALYNYCAGREDLARQCYLESLGALQALLHDAMSLPGTGLARIAGFVREAIGHDRPIAAIAAELDLLSGEARAEVEREQDALFDRLAALIATGQRDGSVRACDAAVAARTIWGLVFWAPLGELWTGRAGENLGARIGAELPPLVERGIVSNTVRGRHEAVAANLLAPILAARPDDRIEEVARAASRLFNRRGVEGVSLDDVAAEVGATKGLFYHHFKSKTALVRHCFERGFEIYDCLMSVAAEGADSVEQSRRALVLNVMAQLYGLHPMSLNIFFRCLPAEDQQRYSQRASALLDLSVGFAERGMAAGLNRRFDAQAVSLASAGTFLFLGRWIDGEDLDRAERTAAEVADFFLYGLTAAVEPID